MNNFISSERLDIYQHHLKVSPFQALAAYHWNKALSGALFPALQCLEVTLRNAIDQAIQSNPPSGAKGLYDTTKNWIFSLPEYKGRSSLKNSLRYEKVLRPKPNQQVDAHNYLLDRYGNRVIKKRIWEEEQVRTAKRRIEKAGKVVNANRVISGLDYGFWTNLLSDKYEDEDSSSLLWPNLLPIVFPNAPHGVTRKDIEDKFNKIRELRNRLSHHEAIWKFHYDCPHTGNTDYQRPVYGKQASCSLLLKHYEDILTLIGWISIDRKSVFLEHKTHLRFISLCSVDGLNSFIEPGKIGLNVSLSKGGRSLKKIVEALDKNQFIRVTRKRDTILTIGKDFLMLHQ
ncbi:Abi family protein [Aeromonas sp. R2-4]|uniref:Abi family protein n=1 Tax=Aeromonas sp. R2-4 TaxID=3138462 RepID=UPI0034A2ED19